MEPGRAALIEAKLKEKTFPQNSAQSKDFTFMAAFERWAILTRDHLTNSTLRPSPWALKLKERVIVPYAAGHLAMA
jgi:hypothetical protein